MYVNIFGCFLTNIYVEVTDVSVTILNQWRFWQILFALQFVMADIIATVACIYAIVFICGRWHHTE